MTGDEIVAMLGPIEAEMTKLRDTPCRFHVERGEQLCLDEGCRAYWHRWRSNVLAAEADAARATR